MTPGTNGEAVTGAFQRLKDRLAGSAWLILGHREDAREAVQEAFLKCWKRRSSLKKLTSLDGWVFSVVLNTARDLRRRRSVRRAGSLPPEGYLPPSEREADPPAAALMRERQARMRESIRKLPEKELDVFLLRQNGDLTYGAIGEILSIPEGTAKTRMRTALARLRDALGVTRADSPTDRKARKP